MGTSRNAVHSRGTTDDLSRADSKQHVYIYVGPETGKRDDAVKDIVDAMRKSFGTVEEKVYYATETPISEVMTMVQGVSLFEDSVCVVLRSAEVIKKKEDIAMIVDWATSNADSRSALILVSDETSIDSKIEKALPGKKVFYEMFDSQKMPYIMDLFHRAGYTIDGGGAQSILDMIDSNTAVLKAECARFFTLFPKGYCITENDVESVLSHDREESAFTLFDAMTSGGNATERLEKSLAILNKIRLSKDNSSVMLIAGLASCFRRLALWHNIGSNANDVKLRSSGFASRIAREQYSRASHVWTLGEAEAILADLGNTDLEIRSGGTAIEDTLLVMLLYRIIIKKGARLAGYE